MTWKGSYYTEVTLDRFLPELWPFVRFSHFINRGSCLRNSSYSFQGILMKLSSYCSHDVWRSHEEDHIIPRSRLTTLYQSYDPLSVLAILSTEVLVSATPPTVFKGFWWNFLVIVPMTWRWSYFIKVILSWFLSELWPFNNFSAVSLVSATPLAVFNGF